MTNSAKALLCRRRDHADGVDLQVAGALLQENNIQSQKIFK